MTDETSVSEEESMENYFKVTTLLYYTAENIGNMRNDLLKRSDRSDGTEVVFSKIELEHIVGVLSMAYENLERTYMRWRGEAEEDDGRPISPSMYFCPRPNFYSVDEHFKGLDHLQQPRDLSAERTTDK